MSSIPPHIYDNIADSYGKTVDRWTPIFELIIFIERPLFKSC
jgi:hypothetical protein